MRRFVLGILLFAILVLFLIYHIDWQSEIMPAISLKQKQNEKEESVKWEKAPYQKYEKWLLDNDSSRKSCSIFAEEEKWRNNPEVYCELWGESFFGNLGADGLVGIKADMFSEGEPITGGFLQRNRMGIHWECGLCPMMKWGTWSILIMIRVHYAIFRAGGLKRGERIYLIDREKQVMADITNTLRWYVNQWIAQEAERVSCSMKVTSDAYEKISG